MPTPFGRSHCPPQSGYFDSSCPAAPVIAVASARKNPMTPIEHLRGCMATSGERASKRKNTTLARRGERAPRSSVRAVDRVPAVDVDRCAADEAGAAGGEEYDKLRNLRGVAGAPGGKFRMQLGPA